MGEYTRVCMGEYTSVCMGEYTSVCMGENTSVCMGENWTEQRIAFITSPQNMANKPLHTTNSNYTPERQREIEGKRISDLLSLTEGNMPGTLEFYC